MSYEHDHITGHRMSYDQRNRNSAEAGGSTGLWLALGGVIVAIMLAVFVLGGDGPATQPGGLGGPATEPAAPTAVQPEASPGAIPVIPAPAD